MMEERSREFDLVLTFLAGINVTSAENSQVLAMHRQYHTNLSTVALLLDQMVILIGQTFSMSRYCKWKFLTGKCGHLVVISLRYVDS